MSREVSQVILGNIINPESVLTIEKKKSFKYDNLTTIDSVWKELVNFIERHKTNKKHQNCCLFGSYSKPFGNLNIKEEEYEDMIELLARYSFLDDEDENHGICIGRKQEGEHLLMIDIDVKTKDKHDVGEYFPWFYKLAVAIADFIGSKEYRVFTRKQYYCKDKKVWKNGAHVIYKDIVIESGIKIDFTSSKEIQELLQVIYEIDTCVVKNDIIDNVSFGKGLIGLIGSRKPESHQYWPVELIDGDLHFSVGKKLTSDDVLLERMNDIRTSMLIPLGNELYITERFRVLEENNKTVSGVANSDRSTVVSAEAETVCKGLPFETTVGRSLSGVHFSNGFLNKLVDLISIQYLTNYESWLKIGMGIKTCGGSIELFDKISQKAKNYGGFESINKKWESFKDDYYGDKITIGTLKYYARLSDPSGYEALCERNKTLEYVVNNYTDCLMIDYLCSNDSDSSGFIKDLRCRCAKETNRVSLCVTNWYHYNGVYYKEIDEGEIKTKLFDPLYNQINEIYKDYKEIVNIITQMQECNKSELKKLKNKKSRYNLREILDSLNGSSENKIKRLKSTYMSLAKKAQNVRDKIKDSNERNRLLTVLQDKAIIKNVEYIADYNNKQSTVVFENGVYDAFEKKMIDCKKNTFSCKKTFTEPSKETIELFERYMISLFPDIRIRTLMYELLAKMLTPDPIQYIIFFTGVGSNGKSCFIAFLEKLLGDYFKAATGSFFSGEVKKGGCDPELVDTIHRRCISVNEPSKGVKLAGSFIKSLTGDDYITARGLYKDNVTWRPTAKHIITCNDIPSTDDLTEGFKRRVIIIPFQSRFLGEESYKKGLENDEFDIALRDDVLIRELMKEETLNEIATLLITKYYNIRSVYDLPEPCQKFKDEYIKSNDPIDSWLEENCELDESYNVELQVVYDDYKKYIEENTNEKKLSKRKFEEVLRNKTKCGIGHNKIANVCGLKIR